MYPTGSLFDDSLHALLHTEAYLNKAQSRQLTWVTAPHVFFGVDMMNPTLSGDYNIKLTENLEKANFQSDAVNKNSKSREAAVGGGDPHSNLFEENTGKPLMLVHWFELDMDRKSVLTTAPEALSTEE